ncbi:MAG TPA: dihydropteroate synthase [Candidatus Krumholzibacterium sp.]|nr:dihydropteroate synthase [Candidatus Krumholzibacterium sp.]
MKTILIGERLNSSNKKIRSLFDSGSIDEIVRIAGKQVEAGASIVDINCSMMMGREREILFETARAVIDMLNVEVSIDSPDQGVLIEGAERFGIDCILNSITCSPTDLERVGAAASASGAGLIVMTKDGNGIPSTPEGRLELAGRAVELLGKAGIADERIFLDPVFSPVATDVAGLETALGTLRGLTSEFPGCRRVGGLSNISFGLPDRRLLNRSFLPVAMEAGLDTVICDVTDAGLMDTLHAAEAITGRDRGCRSFLRHYRSKKGPE